MRRILGPALALGMGALAACGGSTSSGAVPCGDAGSCPNNLVCQNGVCVATGGGGGAGGFGGFGGFGGNGSDVVAPGQKWPATPTSGGPGSGTSPTVIAVYQLFLGDTDRNGNSDATAWKDYGYNLDGIISTKTGTNHCRPKEGIPKSKIQTDGTNGVDNSYGSNLIPIVQNLSASPTQNLIESLQSGSFTLIFRLNDLDQKPNQTSVTASYYGGAPFDALIDCASAPTHPNCYPPLFDGSDAWPVTFDSLLNPNDIGSAKVQFSSSYVAGGTWVSSPEGGSLTLVLNQGLFQTLPLARAVVTMTIDANGNVNDGIIAGVLPTQALINELKKTAGSLDPGLCSGPTFDSVAQQIAAASDIMADGSNGDPSLECDGISLGFGFTGRAIQLGGIAPPVPTPPDPCAN